MSTLGAGKPFYSNEKGSNAKQSNTGACSTPELLLKLKPRMSQSLSYRRRSTVPNVLTTDIVAAATPDYFAQHGHPERPDDLVRHRCLPCESNRWHFDTPDGSREVCVPRHWQSNNMRLISLACRRGLGIAYLTRAGFGSALQDGSLVTTLEPYWARRGFTTSIVYPSRKYLPAHARRAVEHLLERSKTWESD